MQEKKQKAPSHRHVFHENDFIHIIGKIAVENNCCQNTKHKE